MRMARCMGAYLLAVAMMVATAWPVFPAVAAQTRVARCNLRLRKEANTKSDTLVTIPGGTEIAILGSSGGWTKTAYNGHTGYASTSYLMELTRSGYYPLKEGDENPYVADVQKRLIELGYMAGSADGVFGRSTVEAVKSFQKSNKIKADGIAGGETQRIMYANTAIAATGTAAATTGTSTAGTTTADTTPSTSSTAGTPSTKTLRLGDRGNDVKSLQDRLVALGYLSGKADGIFGAATQKAVVDFQKKSSLTSDGKAGTVTQNLLYSGGAKAADGTTASVPSSTTGATEYATLKRGMTSNAVKTLQQSLKDLGYMTANATGFYGSQTQLAVQDFQRAHNLTADGVAGSATQMTLYSSNAKPNASGTTGGTTTYATLKEGMKSAAVTTMQKKLKTLGYLSANATGFYGTATKAAVIAFQRANRLNADGVAGSATLTSLYGAPIASGGSSGTGGSGKISGPAASSVKLLHWFNAVRPSLRSGSGVMQVYDPATGYGYKLKSLSLGNHCDSEPLTAEDTLYMNAAFGNMKKWDIKPVYVQLPGGTWTMATMHNVPHLSGKIENNNFDGHLCVHFLRDMDECAKNDPNYGVANQKSLRAAWKNLTGETIN